MTILFPTRLLPRAAKSTFKTTVSLTRKTGAQLKSKLESTLNFLARRTDDAHGRRKGWAVLVPMAPKAKDFSRRRSFEPVTAGNQII